MRKEWPVKVKEIPLDQILLPETQVRTVASEEAHDELMASMDQFGLLEPIVVVQEGDFHRIVAGTRRFVAARELGWKKIAANILNVDPQTGALLSLEENIKREDINPYEEALYYLHLIKTHGMTQTEIANRLGLSKQAVHNRMALLDLDPVTTEYIQRKELSMTHAVELGRIGDLQKRANVREHVLAHELSTVATRHLVDQVLMVEEVEEKGGKITTPMVTPVPEEITHYKCAFCNQPGSKVRLNTLFVCGFCLEALAAGAREADSGESG